MLIKIVAIGCALLLPLAVLAQPAKARVGEISATVIGVHEKQGTGSGRAAWQWSDAERVARRTDAEAARARVEAVGAARAQSGARRHVDVISGKTNPELFMPTELFASVVAGAFLFDGWANVHTRNIAAAGLPADFLPVLRSLSGTYLPLLAEQETLRKQRNQMTPTQRAVAIARLAALDRDLCREGAATLAKARARWGTALDRFLYGPVAASRVTYFDELPDGSELLRRERGCS